MGNTTAQFQADLDYKIAHLARYVSSKVHYSDADAFEAYAYAELVADPDYDWNWSTLYQHWISNEMETES